MATYALIHGACDVGRNWQIVERELHGRGHRSVAPDPPIGTQPSWIMRPDSTGSDPWPLDAWPDVQTHANIGHDDRFFPAALPRGVIRERLDMSRSNFLVATPWRSADLPSSST